MRIHAVQGFGHRSPFEGAEVAVCAVVTVATGNRFWLQEPSGSEDADPATSEGAVVALDDPSDLVAGDVVVLHGIVNERADWFLDLPATELRGTSFEKVQGATGWSETRTAFAATGRLPPEALDSDPSTFDPLTDAADFYESVESMRVTVYEPVVVGGTQAFGELVVLPGAVERAIRSRRGGLLAGPSDFNPERLLVRDALGVELPIANVGDRLDGEIEGVLAYERGQYVLFASSPLPAVVATAPPAERTNLVGTAEQATVGTYNLHNLTLADSVRMDALAAQVVGALGSPDVLAVQEVQDDDGTATETLSAERTLAAFARAIIENGGPEYAAFDMAPSEENEGGGDPNGNIRPAFLYRTDRVVFIPRSAVSAAAVVGSDTSGALVSPNPALVSPDDAAWQNSRKPLVAQLCFNGRRLTFVDVHLRSRRGDDPPFCARQPPVKVSEAQRSAQVGLIADFADRLLSVDPAAFLFVLGDFNDEPFSPSIQLLARGPLTNALDRIAGGDRYTYNFRGNSHAFDQIFLAREPAADVEVDIVHVNADFAQAYRASDHDPVVIRFSVPRGRGCS